MSGPSSPSGPSGASSPSGPSGPLAGVRVLEVAMYGFVPEIVSPYAGGGMVRPGEFGGVMEAADVPRAQNAVMS